MTQHARAALPPKHIIETDARRALEEDLGPGDLTANLLARDCMASAEVISREQAILCGTAWFEAVMHQIDPKIHIEWQADDGEQIAADRLLCRLHGSARSLLSAERSALNFLQTLSATATQARHFVEAVAHTRAVILDTRKTLPGLRHAQKYASRCGGACNHRSGLYDGILIKENHILAAGGIEAAVATARQSISQAQIVVEVETLEELEQARQAGAHRVLLDNFTLAMMRQAVEQVAGTLALEASGGIDLGTIATIAETGVDFISVGAITKHVQAIDLSMRIREMV